MSDDQQDKQQIHNINIAPNQGAQGTFYRPVMFDQRAWACATPADPATIAAARALLDQLPTDTIPDYHTPSTLRHTQIAAVMCDGRGGTTATREAGGGHRTQDACQRSANNIVIPVWYHDTRERPGAVIPYWYHTTPGCQILPAMIP